MRHIGTLIAALLIAPSAWILVAFGQDRSVEVFADAARGGGFHTGAFVHPVELLAGAGLLLGILATLRFSPLGAVLTGLGYALSYVLMLVAPAGTFGVVNREFSLAGHHVDLATPVRNGTTLVLGALLLVGVVSVGRWRRWPRPDAEVPDDERDRPVGVDGLDLAPTRDLRPAPTRDLRPAPAFDPEPEPEYAGWGRTTGFRPKARVAGLRSPWGSSWGTGDFRDRAG